MIDKFSSQWTSIRSLTLPRLGASAKFWQKNVFLRPFWAIFRPASGIFRKGALDQQSNGYLSDFYEMNKNQKFK